MGARSRAAETEAEAAEFLIRRAYAEVSGLAPVPERVCLLRVLDALVSPVSLRTEAGPPLLELAGQLESGNRFDEAARVLDLSLELDPEAPELLLHAARVARKAGKRARAGRLYDEVYQLDGTNGHLARMAELGHALLDPNPELPLSRVLRRALEVGDELTAAVAQEERARARRAAGDVPGALRDYAIAAVRYRDPADLGRIGHEAADLLVLSGDLAAARRALLEVERRALPRQAERARSRLLELSRALGDELGVRRWADSAPPSLVSPSPRRERAHPAHRGPTRIGQLDGLIGRLRRVESTVS